MPRFEGLEGDLGALKVINLNAEIENSALIALIFAHLQFLNRTPSIFAYSIRDDNALIFL